MIHHPLLDGAPVLVVDGLGEDLGASQVGRHDDQRVLKGHGVALVGGERGRQRESQRMERMEGTFSND